MWRPITTSTPLGNSFLSTAVASTPLTSINRRADRRDRIHRPRHERKPVRQFIVAVMTSALILTSIPLTRSGTALAFKPTEGMKYSNDLTHESITQQALSDIINNDGYLPGIRRVVPSIKRAIDSVIGGNVRSDLGPRYFVGEAHFTDELFVSSQNLLHTKLESLVRSLRNRDPGHARILLGQILHAIQDFYSHSNWIEKGDGGVYELLGKPGENFNPAALAGSNEATCTDCTKCVNCDNNVSTNKLTSAYWGQTSNSPKPSGKCSHGSKVHNLTVPNPWLFPPLITIVVQDFSQLKPALGGISKDSSECADTPHSHLHLDAARRAYRATVYYLKEVIKKKLTPYQLKTLFGAEELAFAVDTTGSMGSQIAQVRTELTRIVNERRGTPNEPARYILMPFNDPGTGPLTSTEDPDVFIAAINSLRANAGDDCPELANTGMLEALRAMDGGGDLMMVTDASSKDGGLGASVRAVAQEKDVKVNILATGSCSPIDPEYYRTASATGGQVFVISYNEVGRATRLADLTMSPSAVEVVSMTDTLGGASKTYDVPVDSTMTRVTFSVSGTPNVTLRRPDGSTVQDGDAGAETIRVTGASVFVDGSPSKGGAVFSITNPATGQWKLSVSAPGSVTVRVLGESPLDFSSFEFVERDGGPGHEGLFPISGSPLQGRAATVRAELSSSDINTANFEFRAADGTPVQSLNLQEIARADGGGLAEFSNGGGVKRFIGEITTPETSFLAYVTGTDANGHAYQRVKAGVIKPQSVRVLARPLGQLHPGEATEYSFQVQNLSADVHLFQISANDKYGFIESVEPKLTRIGPRETRSIKIKLRVPASATVGDIDFVTLTARDAVNTDLSNSAMVEAEIAASSPVKTGSITATPMSGGDFIAPGTEASLGVQLLNTGTHAATNVSATLVTSTPGVEITNGHATYEDLAPTGGGLNETPFSFRVSADVPCGQMINFILLVRHDGYDGPVMYDVVVRTVAPPSTMTSDSSYAGAAAIPPVSSGVDIPLEVSGVSGKIEDLKLRLDSLDYDYIGALEITLTSPQGTSVLLVKEAWDGNRRFRNTLLDDQATRSIQSITWWEAPYTGAFAPVNPLGLFNGEDPNGTWTLNVRNQFYWPHFYAGNVNAFTLLVTTALQEANGCDGTATPGGKRADLFVSTESSSNPVLSGSELVYKTTLKNDGPDAAKAVVLNNTLPAGTSATSCEATNGGICNASGDTVTFATLAAGASATVTITVAVECPTPDAALINYSANVTSEVPDPNLANNSAAIAVTVSNPAPTITNLTLDRTELWPPNHQMVDIAVAYDVTDNCGPLSTALSITSNEPVDGLGDGDTSPDWEVIDDHHLRLRAERAGGGIGRVYTILLSVTDSAGNTSNRSVTVQVPKSKNN